MFTDHNRSLSHDQPWHQCKYDLVRKMQLKFCRQTTLTAAPGSIPGKNHGLRLILDAEVRIFGATSKVKTGLWCFIFATIFNLQDDLLK